MKKLYIALFVFFLLSGSLYAQTGPTISGKVVETMNSAGYTYVLLQEKGGAKIWVAVPQMKVTVGKQMTFANGAPMLNYESKTLNRKFDKVIFSPGPAQGTPSKAGAVEEVPHGMPSTASVGTSNVKVTKATGPGAYTIAELYSNINKLQKQSVTVRGKVMKATPNIMDTNWLHIQDGTGKDSDKTNDLVVTTSALPSVGDVVTIKGILAKDRDFGLGYRYDVIVEGATVKK